MSYETVNEFCQIPADSLMEFVLNEKIVDFELETEKLNEKCKALEEENSALKEKQINEAEMQQALALTITTMEEDLKSRTKLCTEMEQKISELQLNLLRIQEERDNYSAEAEKHSTTTVELQQKIQSLEEEVHNLQQKQINESQVHELQTLSLKFTAMQEDVKSQIMRHSELEQQVSQLELELKRKTAECDRLGDVCDKFDEEEAEYKRKLASLYEENRQMKRQLEETKENQRKIQPIPSHECPESSERTLLDVCSPIAKRRATEEKPSPSNRSNCKQQ